jgi:hypothetical protein
MNEMCQFVFEFGWGSGSLVYLVATGPTFVPSSLPGTVQETDLIGNRIALRAAPIIGETKGHNVAGGPRNANFLGT